jgi:zinc protease
MLNKLKSSLIALIAITLFSCAKDEPKRNFEKVKGDPLGVKIYTLENGLKVYLSENKDEPRIYTNVAVRTGSKNDPEQFTGLAHYLEHMVFKGTSKIGTVNWEAEKVELEKIADLYEKHANTNDPAEKAAIYAKIDSISQVAASYAAPNELDKLVKQIGASGTNAYTWLEETVYLNDIPSNELERWAIVESERMSELVLRLFHTELEAVYEEFNLGQASDFRKVNKKSMELLFPTHPYGTQTTIGKAEHLKNPSMRAIHDYFKNYYVANNMAVMLAGDFNSDEAIEIIEKHFGKLKKGDIKAKEMPVEEPITEIKRAEVFGPQQEFLNILYRFGGESTDDADYMTLISEIMSNGKAGLFDLNLNQKQKVLSASAYNYSLQDYGFFTISATPKQNQSLEEVEALVIAEIEKLKQGDFDDDLLPAIIKNLKLQAEQIAESNRARVSQMVNSFVRFSNWERAVNEMNRLEKITKQDIVNFANEHFKENYVVVYKRLGEDPDIILVDKPQITPISIDRSKVSDFALAFDTIPTSRLKPVFVDYEKELKAEKIDGKVPFYYIKNDKNKTFTLYLLLETGSQNNPKLALAANYLNYLGTDNFTAEELKKKQYSAALSINVFPSSDVTYIIVSGLEESFEEGVNLMRDLLSNPKADEAALAELKADQMKRRANQKLNARAIRAGLTNYAKHGKVNPFNNNLSNEDLNNVTSEELIDLLKSVLNTEHLVMYYGSQERKNALGKMEQLHKLPTEMLPLPNKKEFAELALDKPKVWFANYDQVPVDLTMMAKGEKYNADFAPFLSLYGEYFGFGLSSIVFQEIRESKALAYSAGAYISSPDKPEKSHYLNAIISTNNDKLETAVNAFNDLLNDMPTAEKQFEGAKTSTLIEIETERITGTSIFWTWYRNQKLGINHDIRKDIYSGVEKMTMQDLKEFADAQAANKTFNYIIVGKRDLMDFDYLKSLGEVKELPLEEIFGY